MKEATKHAHFDGSIAELAELEVGAISAAPKMLVSTQTPSQKIDQRCIAHLTTPPLQYCACLVERVPHC